MLTGMTIHVAQIEDAAEILALQILAYQTEAVLYDDFNIPPLKQTQTDIEQELGEQTVLKACLDGRIIGSVRAFVQNGTCFIGKLIVHPHHRRQGLATQLMHSIEDHFPGIRRFELFTGHRSEGNLRLYNNLGYRIFRELPVSEKLTLVFLEKETSSVTQ